MEFTRYILSLNSFICLPLGGYSSAGQFGWPVQASLVANGHLGWPFAGGHWPVRLTIYEWPVWLSIYAWPVCVFYCMKLKTRLVIFWSIFKYSFPWSPGTGHPNWPPRLARPVYWPAAKLAIQLATQLACRRIAHK